MAGWDTVAPDATHQRGFALATTLWLLAILTVAAGYLAFWAERTVADAWQMRQLTDAELDRRGTEAVLLYLMATRPLTLAGLSLSPPPAEMSGNDESADVLRYLPAGDEIALDDRLYQGMGEALFSLQDEGGLVSLAPNQSPVLERLLGLLDVPVEQRDPLLAKLYDYADDDDFYRLNGAEARQYEEVDLPPPPNRDLLGSWELRQVLGWREQASLWQKQRLPRSTTVHPFGLPNFNTAPLIALQTLPGVDSETARRLVAGRPFLSLEQARMVAGTIVVDDPDFYPLLSSAYLRLTIAQAIPRRAREIHIELTPFAEQAPWSIDYAVDIPWDAVPATTSAPRPDSALFAAPRPAVPP
jgi:DNA uptake protein ComE-like DNA-binding protein